MSDSFLASRTALTRYSHPSGDSYATEPARVVVKVYVILSVILVGASFFLMGAGSFIPVEKTMALLILALNLNRLGIDGEQVAGVVDALHEAIAAGYLYNPLMHGLIAGLGSLLSGTGRFVSRVSSGFLVDNFGFDATAAIVTTIKAIKAASMLTYYIPFEFNRQERSSSVHWHDMTSIDEQRSRGGKGVPRQVGKSKPRRFVFTHNTWPSK